MTRIRTTIVMLALAAMVFGQRTAVNAYATYSKWPSAAATVFINPQNADVTADAAEAALLTAMDAWNTQGASPFRYTYGGRVNDTTTGSDGRNVIIFRNATNGGALATTYWWFSGSGIYDADIVIWDASYTFFTGTSGCNGGAYIEDIATHELGHALGLDHSSVADATMYPSYSFCSQELRTLAADDIAGLQSLYGTGSTQTQAPPPPPPPPSNTVPTVSIGSPSNNSSFVQGALVSFTGSASDVEDGSLTSSMQWTSSLDGLIGIGGAFSTTSLSVGKHVITASATDSGQLMGSKQVNVTITSTTAASPKGAKGKGNRK